MSLKHLLDLTRPVCWIEYREATSQFRVSLERDAIADQDAADYWTEDAADAERTADAMARAAGCVAILASKAAEHAAGRGLSTAIISNT